MIVIIDKFNLDILELPQSEDYLLCYFYTNQETIERWIKFNRVRTIFDKREILNMFNIREKAQIVKAEKIKIKPYDKIIIKHQNRFFVLELIEAKPFCKNYLLTNKK